MTARKNSRRTSGKPRTQKKIPQTIIIWTIIFIIFTGLFLINRETIKKNFSVFYRQFNSSAPPVSEPSSDNTDEKPAPSTVTVTIMPSDKQPAVQPAPPVSNPVEDEPAPASPAAPPSSVTQTPPAEQTPSAAPPSSATQTPSAATQASPGTQPSSAAKPATTTQPASAAPPSSATQTPQKSASQPPAVQNPKPVETRDRNIYFVRIENNGAASLVKAGRKLPVSDSPMLDSLQALLKGPSAEEQGRGIMTVIPRNTRIINATVRGSTAYINFSEEFQYNTFGVEGHAAQVKQIVWTATEFSNIKDVQILINGRPLDFLGEGVWIGSPVTR